MKRVLSCICGVFLSALVAYGQATSASSQRVVVDQYCVACHNEKAKTAGLMLDKMDLAHIGENAEVWEKFVRKLRAGMMPPLAMPRPNAAAYEALTVSLENELDRAAAV
jgi:cytochrome c551/c552